MFGDDSRRGQTWCEYRGRHDPEIIAYRCSGILFLSSRTYHVGGDLEERLRLLHGGTHIDRRTNQSLDYRKCGRFFGRALSHQDLYRLPQQKRFQDFWVLSDNYRYCDTSDPLFRAAFDSGVIRTYPYQKIG